MEEKGKRVLVHSERENVVYVKEANELKRKKDISPSSGRTLSLSFCLAFGLSISPSPLERQTSSQANREEDSRERQKAQERLQTSGSRSGESKREFRVIR